MSFHWSKYRTERVVMVTSSLDVQQLPPQPLLCSQAFHGDPQEAPGTFLSTSVTCLDDLPGVLYLLYYEKQIWG